MSEVVYKILNYSNLPIEGNIESLKLRDRNHFVTIHDSSFLIEIEFPPCFIDQIQIGIMNSSKILIHGKHRSENIKRLLIDRTENVSGELKAIVYDLNKLSTKKFEVTNLILNFISREKLGRLSINYIFVLKCSKDHILLSPIPIKTTKSKYEFIDGDNSRLQFDRQNSLPSSTSLIDSNTKNNEKNLYKSSNNDTYLAKLNSPIQHSRSIKEKKIEPWQSSNFYNSDKKPEEPLRHSSSYSGLCTGIMIFLKTSFEFQTILTEICDVLGIIVFDQDMSLVDYLVCESLNEEISYLAEAYNKPVVKQEWLLECVNKRTKLNANEFLFSYKAAIQKSLKVF